MELQPNHGAAVARQPGNSRTPLAVMLGCTSPRGPPVKTPVVQDSRGTWAFIGQGTLQAHGSCAAIHGRPASCKQHGRRL